MTREDSNVRVSVSGAKSSPCRTSGMHLERGMQVELKGFSHQVILVRGPEDCNWRLVDAGFGGITPTHPLLLEHPSDDSYTGMPLKLHVRQCFARFKEKCSEAGLRDCFGIQVKLCSGCDAA